MQKWGIYQFHDTFATAGIRRRCYQGDNPKLHSDASNLAPFLLKLQAVGGTPYHRIIETIRLIAPWFGDFVFEPIKPHETDVLLSWHDRYSDNVFGPHQLPDGALRATAQSRFFFSRKKICLRSSSLMNPNLDCTPLLPRSLRV